MSIGDVSGKWHGPYKYCMVWDYFQSSMNYSMWNRHNHELIEFFSGFDGVYWHDTSFRFTIQFTETDWLAVDMLQPMNKRRYVSAHEYSTSLGEDFDRVKLTIEEFNVSIRAL